MQGGGTGIFAAIPLNMMKTGTADYFVTGKKNCFSALLFSTYSKIVFLFLIIQVHGQQKLQRKQRNMEK